MDTIIINASYGKHINLDATHCALETDGFIRVINSAQQHTNQRPVTLKETYESLKFVVVAVVAEDTDVRAFTAKVIHDYLSCRFIELREYQNQNNIADLFFMNIEHLYFGANSSDKAEENTGKVLYCGLGGFDRNMFVGLPEKYYHDFFRLDPPTL